MAKGGGRGKGRPRKLGILAGATTLVAKEVRSESNTNGTVHEGMEIGENSGEYTTVGLEAVHACVSGVEGASTDTSMAGDLDLEREKEEAIVQIPKPKNELPLRNRGMKLDYVAPTLKQGTPTACLDKSEIEKENLKWKRVVILYVIGDAPSITYLSNYLKTQCNIEQKFDIYYHAEGYFVIRFESMADRDRILYDDPHTVANRPTIVNEWVMNFSFEKEILKEIPLWIKLPNLPLNCWSNDSLSRIGSVIGKPVCADECTTNQNRISYARLLVEVDITQPLKYRVQVEGEMGQIIEQKIVYDWVPVFCQKCHKLGHTCKDKQAPKAQKIWVKKQTQVHMVEQKEEEPKEQQKPNDKGKRVMQEEWSQPKRTASATIQVGRLHIMTSNVFEPMQKEAASSQQDTEGGGRIPLNQG